MRTQLLSIFLFLGILFSTNAFGASDSFFAKNGAEKANISVYPNPIKDKGVIQFKLNEASVLKIEFFDLSGKKVKEIKTDYLNSGTHKIEFNAEQMKEGVYMCKVTCDSWVSTQRILLRR